MSAEAMKALDYRMVEWWAPDGKTYSLVQVVSRLAAIEAARLDREALAKALHRVITLDPNSGGDFDTAPHTEAAWSGYAEDIAAEYERLTQEPAQISIDTDGT